MDGRARNPRINQRFSQQGESYASVAQRGPDAICERAGHRLLRRRRSAGAPPRSRCSRLKRMPARRHERPQRRLSIPLERAIKNLPGAHTARASERSPIRETRSLHLLLPSARNVCKRYTYAMQIRFRALGRPIEINRREGVAAREGGGGGGPHPHAFRFSRAMVI